MEINFTPQGIAEQMTCLGYELRDAQNMSFKPKTQLIYGEADMGFNWWEGEE